MKLVFHPLLLFGLLVAVNLPNAAPAAENEIDFQKQIQPLLAKHCYACHGPDEAESGLSFADKDSAFAEADSGDHAIVAGDVDSSQLIARIVSDDEGEQMPPEGDRLSKEQIELLSKWIEQGANWKNHWGFEPLSDPAPPVVEAVQWQSNGIDAFVYQGLHRAGMKPSAPASKQALIRRLYYSLTGLPPTAEQVQSFVNDQSPDAYQQRINELLAAPQYGEHWGRHWLDLVHFAETNSYERDGPKPNAWKYRDYVIRSFNDDKPYDQFVREQLAGDELEEVTVDTLTATGFYRLGIWDDEPADGLQAKFDGFDDIITTTGQVFLGLTLNCARCHDHKIDPIPQTDYYSYLSFFQDLTPYGVRGNGTGFNQIDVTSDEVKAAYRANDAKRVELEKLIREIEQAGIAKMSAPDQRATEGPRRDRQRVLKAKLKDNLDGDQWTRYNDLKQQLTANAEAAKKLPAREQVLGVARYERVDKPMNVLFRGSPHSPADEVQPRFPELFEAANPEFPQRESTTEQSTGRRTVLADWITSDDNRLTARVMVNRIWQFHFGRGIVRSSNNFGQLGTPPTHPELLDYLANRFIESDYSVKAMHRLILNSKTYQMSSQGTDAGMASDPNNDLLWRFDPRRLSSEEVRDSVLAASGSLNLKSYGPSIYPKLSREAMSGQSRPGSGWGNSSPEDQNRRSVYIYVKRSLLTPLLSAFDFPDPDVTCEGRFMTLQPSQALSLLNGEFAHQQSVRMRQTYGGEGVSDEAFVKATIRGAISRDAEPAEVSDGVAFIQKLQQTHGVSAEKAKDLYCLSVLNWNEFLFVD